MSVAASAAEPEIDPADYARRWWILAVLCVSLVLIVAANASLNVALPSLVRQLGATQTQLQWLVDAYALVFAGLLLPAGAIGDRFGRKGALQFGLVVFGLAAFGASTVDSASQVIALRALMGVGAAFVMPATLSLLTAAFPPGERTRAIAIWAGFAGAGGAIGLVASGLLLERFWWGSVFFVNLPIVAVALVAGWQIVPTSRDSRRRPLDPVGAALSIVGLGAALFAIIEGPVRGWTSTEVVVAAVVGVVGLAVFAWWERRTTDPMLDLTWFRDRRMAVGSTTITLAFFAMFGVFFLLTQYLQFVLGYSPLKAGVASLPMALSMIMSAPRSAGLVTRFGPRRVVTVGLAMIATALLMLSLLTLTTPYIVVGTALVILGLGAGAVMPPSTGQIMSSLPLDKAGVGSAVNDTTREVGGAAGVAVLGSILTVTYRGGLGEALAGVPAETLEVASHSVGAALQAATGMADPAAAAEGVRLAFTDGIGVAFLVAALATLVNAAIVWRYAPRRELAVGPADAGVEPVVAAVSEV